MNNPSDSAPSICAKRREGGEEAESMRLELIEGCEIKRQGGTMTLAEGPAREEDCWHVQSQV